MKEIYSIFIVDYKLVECALKDIHDKMDLNDDRVQVYCQPVLNTKIGSFLQKTA
ncbi:MAG: hypothetical protein SOZ81_06225 [Agathobacter sp.]|nr:hypothetical protein [Agathobacter sp.]